MTLNIPPLRDRRDDIPMLAQYYLQEYAEELQKPVRGITDEAMGLISTYDWPGNVRELQNVIERAVLITDHERISVNDLPDGIGVTEMPEDRFNEALQTDARRTEEVFLQSCLGKLLTIDNYTKEFILKYEDKYTEQQIADMLGITRKSLWEKRKKWGISKDGRIPKADYLQPALNQKLA